MVVVVVYRGPDEQITYNQRSMGRKDFNAPSEPRFVVQIVLKSPVWRWTSLDTLSIQSHWRALTLPFLFSPWERVVILIALCHRINVNWNSWTSPLSEWEATEGPSTNQHTASLQNGHSGDLIDHLETICFAKINTL